MNRTATIAARCFGPVRPQDPEGSMTDPTQAFLGAQRRFLGRYGVETVSRFVDVPSIGGRAHILVTGAGPDVVLVNGIGTPGAMWAPLMAELRGLRLSVIDLPAYGLSDPAPGLAKDIRRGAVRFLEDVLDGLDLGPVPFVANSLGSLWASWLALERPARISALVHVGCPAMVLHTSAPFPMRLLSVYPLGRFLTRLQPPSSDQVEQLAKLVGEHPLVPELVDLLVATERLPGFRRMLLATLHTLLRIRGSRPATRLTREQLARIEQPTLLFWGADDPFGSPAVGELVASSMPAAELHVVAGGHAPWLRQARRIGPTAVGFLSRHARKPRSPVGSAKNSDR